MCWRYHNLPLNQRDIAGPQCVKSLCLHCAMWRHLILKSEIMRRLFVFFIMQRCFGLIGLGNGLLRIVGTKLLPAPMMIYCRGLFSVKPFMKSYGRNNLKFIFCIYHYQWRARGINIIIFKILKYFIVNQCLCSMNIITQTSIWHVWWRSVLLCSLNIDID